MKLKSFLNRAFGSHNPVNPEDYVMVTRNRFSDLEVNTDKLQLELDQLEEKFYKLETAYVKLRTDHAELQKEHDQLEIDYEALSFLKERDENKVTDLRSERESLAQQVVKLENSQSAKKTKILAEQLDKYQKGYTSLIEFCFLNLKDNVPFDKEEVKKYWKSLVD